MILYHATHGDCIESIMANGLDSRLGISNHKESDSNFIYFADSEFKALIFAGSTCNMDRYKKEDFYIISIDTDTIGEDLVFIDNNIDSTGYYTIRAPLSKKHFLKIYQYKRETNF